MRRKAVNLVGRHRLTMIGTLLLLTAAVSVGTVSFVVAQTGGETSEFSPPTALATGTQLAQQFLDTSIGAHGNRESTRVLVDGRPIQLSDFRQVEMTYHGNASSVASQSRAVTAEVGQRDVWVIEWQRDAITIPDWNGGSGVVRLAIVFEDATGKLLAANVAQLRTSEP